MKYERIAGGMVAAVLLMSKHYVLLVRGLSHPDPKLKLPVETNKPGESILNTLKSCLEEETGLKDIKTELGSDGKIARFNDPRIIKVVQFGPAEEVHGRHPHWRYLYGVYTTDEIILELSGKYHHIEELNDDKVIEIESLETKAVRLTELADLPDLLRPHAELIRSIPQRIEQEIR